VSRRFARAPADRRSLAVIAAIAASLLLAACGGSGTTSTASTASTEKSREQQFIQFTKCLREHGVNVPTPTAGQPFRLRSLRGNRQAFEVARTACKQYAPKFGGANISPAERIARQEAVRKFAKCMREHGVPLEVETNTSGGGPGTRIHLGQGSPSRESPAFEKATKACSGLLPKRPGGGRGFFRGDGPGGGPPPGASGAAATSFATGATALSVQAG
jgi:hypothetical protein